MGRQKCKLFLLAVALLMALFVIACEAEEETPEVVTPPEDVDDDTEEVEERQPIEIDRLTQTGYGPGTMAYSFSAGIAEGVEQVTGIRTRVIPGGNDFARVMPLRAGEAELTIFTGGTGWFVSRGTEDFATEEWGPQPIRVAWRGADLFVGAYTQGDSGIETIYDVKGRRGVFMPGSPTITMINRGFVAFADLDPDEDVVWETYPGHGAAGQAMIDGAVDFYNFGTTGDRPMELAASPRGIRWLDLYEDDQEAWARMQQIIPWVVPGEATRGADITPDNPVWTLRYPYNIWSYRDIDDDIVYTYSKGIWDSYDIYKDTHAELPFWDHEAAVDVSGNAVPFHDGLVQMLKDQGVWTDEHEAWQQVKVEREQARLDLWEELFDRALAEEINFRSDEWKALWWDALDENDLLTVYQ